MCGCADENFFHISQINNNEFCYCKYFHVILVPGMMIVTSYTMYLRQKRSKLNKLSPITEYHIYSKSSEQLIMRKKFPLMFVTFYWDFNLLFLIFSIFVLIFPSVGSQENLETNMFTISLKIFFFITLLFYEFCIHHFESNLACVTFI